MRLTTGGAFAGFKAQKYWSVHSIANLVAVPGFIARFFQTTHWHEFKSSILDRVLFIAGLSLALGLLPAMSGHFLQNFQSKAPLWIAVFLLWTAQILLLIRLITLRE